jgi:two-component sensor histidine kinase
MVTFPVFKKLYLLHHLICNLKKYLLILIASGYCQLMQAQPVDKIISTLAYPKQKADTLQYLGRKFHMKAIPDSAAYCYKLGLSFAKQVKDNNTQIIQLYNLLSRVSQMQRQPEKALAIIREADPYITPSTPKPTLENYLLFTAQYFRLLLKYDSSLYFFQQTEKLNNGYRPYGNWYVYDGMAEIFLANSNVSKAEEYYLKAYTLTKKEGIRMDHGLMISRLANLYSRKNDPGKFAGILREHEEFIKSAKKDFRKDPVHSLLFINWGNTPLQQKVEFMRTVRDEHVKNSYFQAAALANYHIASLYEFADQPEEALKYLYETRDFFIGKNAPADSYPNLQYIYRLQIKTGKSTEAILTANQLLELNTKLADMTNNELALELEKKYETEKKEKEIELLNSQNKLNAVELLRESEQRLGLEKQNILKDSAIAQQQQLTHLAEREKDLKFSELEKEKLLNNSLVRENELKEKLMADNKQRSLLLLTGLTLFAIAGTIILIQYRRQLRKNRIIEKQREDLVVLNREIHHRVKNNLQVISSLLDLQSESTDDRRTAEKFLEGSQRVQSMAYIHQNLYQGDRIDCIDIQQYIHMLTSNLMQSYNAEADNIKLTTEIEDIKLHSDTVIPLGMIINELVSNSLKYAFKNKETGQIKVVLKQIDEKLLLQVKDNGVGIPDNLDVATGNSFGYKIIKAFTQKLKALMTIKKNDGTDVQLLISRYKMA